MFGAGGLVAGAALGAGLWRALLPNADWGLLAVPAGALLCALSGAILRDNFFD